jgi:hypothetical protein
MDTSTTGSSTYQISSERLMAFVREMSGLQWERPSDDQPLPPGPWDPLVRAAVRGMSVFGPSAQDGREFAWAALLRRHPEAGDVPPRGGGGNPLEWVALNPQPLPPRVAFLASLAETLVERAELLQEMAAGFSDEGEQRGIIIVSGYLSRLIDEFCGTGYLLRFPFPGPRPGWFPRELEGLDLLVMAAQVDQAARETYSPALRETLTGAGAKLVEAALSKMQ